MSSDTTPQAEDSATRERNPGEVQDGAPKSGSSTKIRIQDLTKQFSTKNGTLTAIDNLSLDIPSGKFFMIVGPSGCGKTTLLRILGGLESITSGSMEIDHGDSDKPVNSMVFQGESIFPWMTVWDNAAYGLKMRGAPKAEIRDVVGSYLDKTGLSKFANSYPHQLSGGLKQRVSLARAFANDPDILLMDEPFSALDEQNKTLLQEELLRIWGERKRSSKFRSNVRAKCSSSGRAPNTENWCTKYGTLCGKKWNKPRQSRSKEWKHRPRNVEHKQIL